MRNHVRWAAIAVVVTAGTAAAEDAFPTREIEGLSGPAHPQGFAVETLAMIQLGEEYPDVPEAADLQFRARFVTLEPGGVVPIHSHEGRPATTFIVSGEAIEHRSDVEGPIVRRAGHATMDTGGIAQWWENVSDAPVTMFVSDVVAPDSPTDG